MATYASTTNPFLKSSSCKKDAPGMARPQGVCCKEKTGLHDRIDLINNNNDNNNGDDHDNCETQRKQQGTGPSSSSASDTDEITKACENLVEATIRLELEEAAKEKSGESQSAISDATSGSENCSLNNIETEISKNEKQEAKGKGDDDDDDEDDDDDDEGDIENGNDGLEPPPMEQDTRRHLELIKKLRLQLRDIEKYAYERGELEQVPQSVLAERQSVIIDTLKERLSLKLGSDEIEKLELDELKRQIDQEIHELIDPLMAKEHLLSQLKTQLTDLERYISHLHGTIGKIHDKRSCACHVHGCLSRQDQNGAARPSSSLMSSSVGSDSLPRTSKLIKSLVTQLICSDVKLRELAKRENEFHDMSACNAGQVELKLQSVPAANKSPSRDPTNPNKQSSKQLFNDGAAWTLHIDKVVLATDSLVNLLTIEPEYQRPADKPIDDNLVESVVRRQLVPAIKDLLSYGLIDPDSIPHPTSYAALLFDPYYILSSLTCFPSSQKASQNEKNPLDRVHVWTVVEDYFKSRNEPGFRSSSVKTLSQSFNLATSMSGPIKITSKQALLIAVDDIIETLANCKPNGPDSHFRAFIYAALNQSKLTTWLRLIFKNKSVIRKYYHNFSFASQPDKMDKLLSTIEPLNQIEFKLRTDVESIEQFVSAF